MTRRKFISELKHLLNDPREAVIRYLTEELKFVQNHLAKRPRPTEGEKAALARAAKAVDPVYLEKTFNFFQPSTLFRWHRQLVACKWDYSQLQKKRGRPRVDKQLEQLVVRLALENPNDGYESLVGRLKVLGFQTNPETIRNILERNGIPPSTSRKEAMTWKELLETHWESLIETDFFTWEGLTPFGLMTYYILFFIRLKDRKIHLAGVTVHPNENWMRQMARNLTDPEHGFLKGDCVLIHDRDAKFTAHFDRLLNESGIKTVKLPPQSPNLNAYAERFVRTVKEQCLNRLLIVGESMLRKALKEFAEHYHHERCHQGLGNVIPFPKQEYHVGSLNGKIRRKTSLNGLLSFYYRYENSQNSNENIRENVS
jgi:putative transposase